MNARPPFLTYDATRMHVRAADLRALRAPLTRAHTRIESLRAGGEHGFFDLPFETDSVRIVKETAAKARKRFRRMIVIGIGGSDLGARTLWQSLAHSDKGMALGFLGNPDPELLAAYTSGNKLWWKETAVCVVSKSGSTLETMSMFFAVREALIRNVGLKQHVGHVYVITDPNHNALHKLADDAGYSLIPHPLNVGGRFSVLSTVGLFPAACAGIDIDDLLEGARWMENQRRKQKAASLPAQFAAMHYIAYKKGKRMHVLMPYAASLSELAFWYRQLWAESLGKQKGKEHVGPTPIAAFGAADQHSQIQLYNEGPNDKVVTFLRVDHFTTHPKVPRLGKGMESYQYMSGMTFEQIMHAELEGTSKALYEAERSNGTLNIPAITPQSIGAVLMFYELATAYMAELMGVDAYNQPGVEAGKKIAKEILTAS